MASAAKRDREIQQQVIRSTLDRIAEAAGVLGYVVIHPKSGNILEFKGFNGEKKEAERYVTKLHAFLNVAQSTVRTIGLTLADAYGDDAEDEDKKYANDECTFVRMRWRHREIIMAPDLNKEYILMVIQDKVEPSEMETLLSREVSSAAHGERQAPMNSANLNVSQGQEKSGDAGLTREESQGVNAQGQE